MFFHDCSISYNKQYIKRSLPQAKEEESVAFQFENEEDKIELIIGDHPPSSGWNIRPHKRPVQVHVNTHYIFK